MTRVREWFSRQKASTLIIASVLAVVFVAVSYVGVAAATNQPSFCRSACHEMRPYHAAWLQGQHKDVSCVACHVDPGFVAGLKHKVVALQEVVSHVRGDTSFPRPTQPDVPDERCVSCHEKVRSTDVGFSHAEHAKRGPCIKCHANTGHVVTIAALKTAGIYSGLSSQGKSKESSAVAVVDGGNANLEGHKAVACSRCHIMSATACSSCHEPTHPARGECTTCHRPGARFVFSHPINRTDCQTCHTTSPTHTKIKAECSQCHQKPGVAWTFGHPGPASNCVSCHARPAGHRLGQCSSCHAVGPKWAFRHPSSGAACTNCHTRPAKHRAGACTTCHATGTSWAFRHPGNGASCTNCHSRPSGHRSGACTTCHSVRSWAFRHSSSSRCSSCHKAPANHYGGGCSSCHSPSRAWRSATFRHPGIPGGEHTYRSFACSNCHPRGTSSRTCAKCHDSASGPSDD